MGYRVLANEIEGNIDTLHVPSLDLSEVTFRGEGPGGRKGGTGRKEGRKEKEREGRENHSVCVHMCVYVADSSWTRSGRFASHNSLTTVFFISSTFLPQHAIIPASNVVSKVLVRR